MLGMVVCTGKYETTFELVKHRWHERKEPKVGFTGSKKAVNCPKCLEYMIAKHHNEIKQLESQLPKDLPPRPTPTLKNYTGLKITTEMLGEALSALDPKHL